MFNLVSEYKPSGDQPKAIKELVEGVKSGKKNQVLLGATGTGKTFTIANVIKEVTCIELVNLVLNEKSSVCTFNSCLGKWSCFDSDGHLYPCDRLCLEEYDLGDVTRMASIEEAFENKNFLKLLQNSISRRQNCIENCEYFKNCYGGCNANFILNEKNKNSVSCHIQKGILKEIKKFIIELNNEKEYDKLNYSLSKVLIKRSIK